MAPSKKRFQWAASTFVYVLGGCSAGLMIGGFVGRLTSNGMGIDQLADVLTGIGAGVMVGAVVTLGSARRLSPQRRARIGSMLFLLSAIAFVALRARTSSATPSTEAGDTRPVVPEPEDRRPVTTPR